MMTQSTLLFTFTTALPKKYLGCFNAYQATYRRNREVYWWLEEIGNLRISYIFTRRTYQ